MSSLLLVLLASARGFVDGFEISLCFSSVGAETCCCCRCCIVLDLLGSTIVLWALLRSFSLWCSLSPSLSCYEDDFGNVEAVLPCCLKLLPSCLSRARDRMRFFFFFFFVIVCCCFGCPDLLWTSCFRGLPLWCLERCILLCCTAVMWEMWEEDLGGKGKKHSKWSETLSLTRSKSQRSWFFLPGFLSRSYNLKKKILQTQCQECGKSQCAQELFSWAS